MREKSVKRIDAYLSRALSYVLGTENANLPSFVVMTDPRGGPIGSASNWTGGFMPAAYQGTLFRSQGSPLLDLATPAGVSDRTQRKSLDLLSELNREHLRLRVEGLGLRAGQASPPAVALNRNPSTLNPGDSELVARILSYELAYQMQTTAADVVDLSQETRQTQEMYGLDDARTADFGRKCLIARSAAAESSGVCGSFSCTPAAGISRTLGTATTTASATTRSTRARPINRSARRMTWASPPSTNRVMSPICTPRSCTSWALITNV